MSDHHGQDERSRPLATHDMQADAVVANLVRYYTLRSDSDSSSDGTAPTNDPPSSLPDHGTEIQAGGQPNFTPTGHFPPGSVHLRDDPTLVALVQLGTLHFNCQRGYISLIDSEVQYILAEATQSISLQDSSKYRHDDRLSTGALKVPLGFGLCPQAIPVCKQDQSSLNASPHLLTAQNDIYFASDMTELDEFKTRPLVAGWPFLRFYAGIPLRTQEGHVIGMLSMADPKPRSGLSIQEIEKMRELASVIIDHLRLVQLQYRLERSQNMVRGLGRFVDGKAVQDLWKDAFDGHLNNLPELKNTLQKQDVGFATTLSTQSPPSLNNTMESTTTLFRDISETSNEPKDTEILASSTAATGTHTSQSPTYITEQFRTRDSRSADYSGNEDISNSLFGSGLETTSGESEGPASKEEDFNVTIKVLFSRASHWVREACDFDGILFVDASIQDIRPGKDQKHRKMASPVHSNLLPGDQEIQDRSCDLLGFSLDAQPRSSTGLPSTVQVEIPQSTLSGLLRRYPRGRVFQFDEYGHLLQTQTIEGETRKTGKDYSIGRRQQAKFDKEKDQLQAYQLLEICPGARSIAFFPLWDPHRDQWYAGSFAWSVDPIRVLQHEELMFLGAFGSCVMAEKSKIDMLTADRAKHDFISSVSHELRTPLHGILASVDSLADLIPDLAQEEIRTITVCGDVLLDTMDHILDYSKINPNNQKLVNLGGRHDAWQGTTNRAGRIDSFDFSKLVENVIEGTFAGFNYRNSPPKASRDKTSQIELYRSTRITPPNMNPNVMVILEIEHQISWLFESQIGAWKRILTNAFGNSLKYTETGFVRVSLQVTAVQPGSQSTMTLQIEDSGIGMSKDFLKHGLYAPFVQANPMSVGTGLGVSIIRQLVDDLDGTINVQSEVDYGTRITIKAPLSLPSSEELNLTAAGTNASVRDIAAWCKGLTICLVGFDYYPELDEVPTGILNVHSRRMLAIRSSITTCAANWFGLKIKRCASMADADGDILIGLLSQIKAPESISNTQPLILFEDFRAGPRQLNGNGLFYLSQPFGPHKFGRVLGHCLEYRSSIPEPGTNMAVAIETPDAISVDLNASNDTQTKDSKVVSLPDYASVPPAASGHPNLARLPWRSRTPSSGHSSSYQVTGPNISPAQIPAIISRLETKTRSIVLLVEDNPINMKILVNLMKKANELYQPAINGLEALHQYQAGHQAIKVIFMDISMPVKDGIQATKEIRQFEAEHSLPRVRIIAVTCFSSAEVQRNAFQNGFDMFVLKPTPMKALKTILDMDPDVVVPPSWT